MICLVRLLYYEVNGKHLECRKCPFVGDCDDESKEAAE